MMNEIYYGQFQDVNSTLWTVRIYKEGYSGDTTELTLADDPIVINYEDDGDVFKPVIYSQCTIKVLTNKILNIYSKNVFDVKIEVYKGDELYWFGYNTPNIYSSDYWSNLDEVEINGIDSLAALKYIVYEKITKNNTCIFQIDKLKDYVISNQLYSHTIYHTYFPDDNSYSIKEYKCERESLNTSDCTFTIKIRQNSTGNIVTIKIDENYHVYYVDNQANLTEIYRIIPEIEANFQMNNNNGMFSVYFADYVWDDKETPQYYELIYEENPNKNRTFKQVLFSTLKKINTNPVVEYFNSINNFDEEILDKIILNESIFFDEEDEPVALNAVVEEIAKYLQCRLIQWGDKYYLYNPEEYAYNYYRSSNNSVASLTSSSAVTHYEDSYVPEVTIAENTSKIQLNDVFSEIKIQSTKKDYDEKIIDDEPAFTQYSVVQDDTRTIDNYKYRVNRFKGWFGQPQRTPFSQVQWTYEKDKAFPVPSKQIVQGWQYPTITNSMLKEWAEKGYKYQPVITTYYPNVYFNGNVNFDRYLLLNMDLLINSLTPIGIIKQDDAHNDIPVTGYRQEEILNRNGYRLLECELSIGEKYWNGMDWEDEPCGFGLYFEPDSNQKIQEAQWYSLGNTVSFDQNFEQTGYLIKIPKEINFTGTLRLIIYRGHPEVVVLGGIYYTWQECILHPNILDGESGTNLYNCYKNGCYYFLKNVSLKYVFQKNIEEKNEDQDITYQVKTNDSSLDVYKKKDEKMLLNSHNFEKQNKMSYSETFLQDQLIETLNNKGDNLRPEQNLLKKYAEYHQEPRLIHSNTFKLDKITPISTLKINYFNNKLFIIGTCEIDIKYQTITPECYEI